MLRNKSASPPVSLKGCRILALGAALGALREGPLAGAALEIGGIVQLEQLAPGGCDLIIIDADSFETGVLAAALKAISALRPAPPLLMVGDTLPAGLVRNVLRLEAADILEAPFTSEQLVAAVQSLLAESQPALAPTGGDSRCWAITGAVGGAGATTITIEIAHALAVASGKDRSVCLVDLNLADGACAAYLGASPTLKLADFGTAADRIDSAMLQAFVTPVSKGLDLMAGVRDANAFDGVGRDAVLRLLEVACECYDWVILDVPRHRRAWTLEALAGCDEILVISELTVPALLAAGAYSDEIEAALGTGMRPRIVLNRLASRMFGPAPSMVEAEKALQRKADAGISSDWEAAAASANLGGPIAQHRPKSKIVKDIQTLVDRLASAPARREPAPKAA
ncbi:cellulose synthase operon protein YhjQ/BcsQ [uncultured Phenylobacterium sp.]|uniref:AAA family ATPase n=1 Tax=uncultured Phenylobacterium sp. TaxID=349273 RepID=UPI0025DE0F69|nr:cellulose synthase operon protein YhjQ/BcsQ [uncultured Phenylobacterium sp.]